MSERLTDQEWPKWGPDFNRWNLDAAAFAKLVQNSPDMWLSDMKLKYLELRIDTRDGGFILRDNDGNIIQPERVLKAIKRSAELFGETTPPPQG